MKEAAPATHTAPPHETRLLDCDDIHIEKVHTLGSMAIVHIVKMRAQRRTKGLVPVGNKDFVITVPKGHSIENVRVDYRWCTKQQKTLPFVRALFARAE